MGENELSKEDVDTLFDKPGAEGEAAAPAEGATADEAAAPAEGAAADQAAPAEETAAGAERQTATAVATAPDAGEAKQTAPPPSGSVSVVATPGDKEQVDAQPVEFSQLTGQGDPGEVRKIDFLLDVPVTVTVELGRTSMVIRDALNLGSGSVVELNKLAGEPVDLLINNKLVARGEVVVVNENFGVKVIDIVSPEERLRYLR
jgi:flagellar motor switch protein FliN/FliY